MSDYKPTEHGGLRKDGEVDQRTQQTEFAYGKLDPVETGKNNAPGERASGGGSSGQAGEAHQGGEGLRKDGQPDQRLKQNQ